MMRTLLTFLIAFCIAYGVIILTGNRWAAFCFGAAAGWFCGLLKGEQS